MPISFTLSPAQQHLQSISRSFAQKHLSTARSLYHGLPNAKARLNATRHIVAAAVKAGFISAQVPQHLGGPDGGGNTPLLDAAIMVEEFYAVDSSVPIAILGASLGLMPIYIAGTPEQQKEFLAPFLKKEGTPLACFSFSEPSGSANYNTNPKLTTAYIDRDELVINGSKLWASNAGGWDYRGPDITTLVCRILPSRGHAIPENVSIVVITREDIARNPESAFSAWDEVETLGFNAVSGPAVKFTNLRVPRSRQIGEIGQGPALVSASFTGSAAIVGAMACGIMRTAFESALEFCKKDARGGKEPIIAHQSVADRLIEMKTKLETSRLLTWKAAHAFDVSRGADREGCYMAKIYASEAAVEVVRLAMAVVGMESFAERQPYPQLMRDAACLPIFDGGNVGVRRRELQMMFEEEEYDPRGMAFGGVKPVEKAASKEVNGK
ncbi:putative acyl-CoA dehydrogenase [Trichophaea hybrida]|nr:putative acyl-CoA dehydrogenase [Trichophaea hybrida]